MVRINFVGDVAIFKEYQKLDVDPLAAVTLPASDFNVANLEFPLPADDLAIGFYDVDDNYRVNDCFSRQLQIDVFDLYSLANNHVMDYGQDGVKHTIDKIASAGSGVFGAGPQSFNTASHHINGISFLFFAFVKNGRWDRKPGEIGPDPYDLDELLSLISSKKAEYNHIIVFPHWGTELVDAPDPKDVVNAKKMIDAGASCVIGHHPHVPQGCELYRDGIIAYSLGSFIYLPDFEKGNTDNSPERDVSICLNIEFSENSILSYTPHKYQLDRKKMIPVCQGNFREDKHYGVLCSVIGDGRYYSKKVRSILLRREIISFISRFKTNPVKAIAHYLCYIKPKHLRKIVGMN